MVKFQSGYALQYFFLCNILEFFHQVGQVCLIIAMGNVGADKLIHKMKELLAAYIFTTWNVKLMELRIDHFFQLPDLKGLPGMTDGDTDTGFSCACSTSASVGIHFHVIRKLKINYVCDS